MSYTPEKGERKVSVIFKYLYSDSPATMRTLLLLALLWSSCRVTKTPETAIPENKDEILFLVFRISKDSIQKRNTIELVSQNKTEGTIKKQDESVPATENYLTLEHYQKDKLTKTMVIEHPLYKRVEYSGNNELKSKTLELKSEEFFIRLQVKGKSNALKISETLKGSGKKELSTLNL